MLNSVFTTAVLAALLAGGSGLFGTRDADEWLRGVDRNLTFKSAEYTALMTIHLPDGRERYFRFIGKVVGEDFALMEYIEPPNQKGVRYLRRRDDLWIYFPRQDHTMQIQGHMLRQGVQGGDLSFEDLTESSSLRDKYRAQLIAETDTTVTIRLVAHDMSVSYPYRELLIDRRTSLPVKMVNGGVGNRPIKEFVILESKRFGDRVYPVKSEIHSLLVKDKWTRFEIESIRFGVDFPPETFTKRMLAR